VIYGKEVEVPEDRVIAAGVEHLQKTGAAEYRLQQAAEAEKRLRKYHQELDAYRDTLATQAKTPGAPATPSAALPNKGARPATTVADAAKIDTLAEKVAASIFRGDMDATKAALREAFSDVAQGRGDATPPSLDVDTVVEAAVAKVREIGKQERAAESETSKRERVNGTFQREFATVWDHPEAFAVAHTRFQALVADPDNAGKPLEDLAREAGTAALSRYPELRAEQHREDPAPRPRAQTPVPDELANRRVVKRTIVRQPAASARKPAAPEAPAVLSNKDYVAQMRANRGLPST
jgi:hypothetical protein